MKKLFTILLAIMVSCVAFAQRPTDLLDRGLVAIRTSNGNFVSWRIMGEEYYDVTYNLYAGGKKIASDLQVSNYTDTSGSTSTSYQVAAVVRGVEQPLSGAVKPWTTVDSNNNIYMAIRMKSITDRNGANATSDYQLNDVSLADLNGDGISEFIVKRPCGVTTDTSQKVRFHVLDCYDINGNRLWWIDLGPNMQAEADEQWDAVAYDWDGDGKAEVLMRGADNMIIHHADGSVTNIGSMTTDHRANGGLPYCSVGNEYLLYLEGATAKPYQIGPSSHPNYADYPLTRGNDSDWGSGIVGHRSTKHFFGAPFLNGRNASIFLARGIYTKEKMVAYDVDPSTHQLTQRWYWECNVNGPWFGQGYHNYAIADVDWDGRDEIVYGSMVIDDNGKGLSTCGLGHGDAQHCSDLDPYRHGQEQFACNESSPNMNCRNATTSEFYYRSVGTGDDGRALAGNFTNLYPGCIGRSTATGMVSATGDKVITELGDLIAWSDLNFRIYWDGDLCEEVVNSPGTEREAVVIKPGSGRIFQSGGVKMCNWSKNNPCATGDIIGDWREELILRSGDDAELRIYTTPYPTQFRNYTLWHDHQYRQAMVWECLGYNQPPHTSYFLGEMEGITIAPPPFTMTGRTEVANGGTITNEDKHFIVCETNDTKVSIADGASPYIVTFNVPSWVQGTAGNNPTASKPAINYTYFTCDVTGGALTGTTRLVKQGDGILNLPKVNMTYSGPTDIWAGTLNFDGTLHNSALWLNRFSELNSDGGEFRSIKADYASVIRPGGKGKVGTITVDGELSLGFGSRIEIDIDGENQTSDCIRVQTLHSEKKTAAAWVNYGPRDLQPVIVINSTNLAAGTYTIAEAESISGSLSNFKVEGTGSFKVALEFLDGKVQLTLGSTRGAGSIVWTGQSSNIWDFAKTENFVVEGDESLAPDIFVSGDAVEFNDNASKFNVTLSDELTVDTLRMNNESKAYTLSGTGKIVSGAFVKEGAGKVTISTDNTYKGGNFLRGGTVSVSSLSNDVLAYGNLGAVTTSAAKFVIENGAVLQTTAAVTNGSPISLRSSEGGVINNSADFVQQKAFTGTLLTKRGAGWLKTSASGANLSRMIIAAGTVQNGNGVAAKVVEFQGGSLVDNVGTNNELNVPKGKTGTWTTANRQSYSNKVTGEGTLNVKCAAEQGSGWVATRTPLTLNLSAFAGTIVAGATIIADGRCTFDTSSGCDKWTLNIPSGVTVQNSGKTLKVGTVTGSGRLGGYSSFANDGKNVANTWTVGNASNFKFDGKVVGSDKFTKVGEGKMTVTAAWETNGSVTVNGGAIHLNSGASLGTGSLTVGQSGRLSGVGSLTSSSVIINGWVQAGSTDISTSGTLDFGGKNLTFNAGSTYYILARKCATASSNGCANISNIGKLTMNGTVKVELSSSAELAEGDSIRIFAANSFSGTPTFDLPAEYKWDTSRISEGLLFVAGISDGINDVRLDSPTTDSSVYDMQGVRLGTSLEGLRPGIYIQRGKKILVK
ncbi:MAG: autotransporter-associated beta strand repeat-containing protein [Bacteroidaceae bacterium]|nr:autotransporter-associated beta strand repeat-containing protein [Bacteroidaceae bacterium]